MDRYNNSLKKLINRKKKLRVGIIGGGFGYYGHYKAYQKINSCEVVAIATNRKIKISKKIKIYADANDLIKSEKLDIISIATIPKLQENLIAKIIKNNTNLFLEKPLGVNYLKCLTKLSKLKNRKIGLNFTFPEIQEFKYFKKKFITNKIKNISINWFFDSSYNKSSTWKNKKKLGGGIIFNYFSHSLYYIEYFFGRIATIQKIKKTNSLFYCNIFTENKIKIFFKLNAKSKIEKKHEILLNQDIPIKLISFDPLRFNKFNIYKNNKKIKIPNLKKNYGKDIRFNYIAILLKRFIRSFNKKLNFRPNHKDGLRNLKWINKIEKI